MTYAPLEALYASDGVAPAVRATISSTRLPGDMDVITDSVANWPHKGIATSGTPDDSGVIIPETECVFEYVLSGTIIHITGFAPGYSDVGHTENQIVILKPTTHHTDSLVNKVEEMASQPNLPSGGTTGQILTKVSDTDGDADWQDATGGGVNLVSKEVPTGTVNGTNKVFTTSQPYVAGSLLAYVNGLSEGFFVTETTPTSGTFTFDVAPPAGSDVFVSYQFAQGSTNEADVLDGYHANATPTPNTIPVLDSNARLPRNAATRKQILKLGCTVTASSYAAAWTSYPLPLDLIVFSSPGNTKLTRVANGVKIGSGVSLVEVSAVFNYFDSLNADRSASITVNGVDIELVGYTRNSPPSGASYTSMSSGRVFLSVSEGDVIGMTTRSGATGTASFFANTHLCVEVLE